ncbi:unnamed protein product [Anisakis simplex]|uniref:ORF3 n=1 Tax=Anisakis simplex TaxID=6269 RepID=A0A0M3JBC2_ANISI|nr:unnamed protein product [Anisakis simplex]
MVSQRSTPKRSPRRRRVHESSRTDSLSTKGDVDGGSGRTSTTSAITWKYFAEESDMPPQRIKPIRTPIQRKRIC